MAVPDEGSEAFLLAYQTLMNTRDIHPQHIISDNGTGFVKANDFIQKAWTVHQVKWHFNVSKAPWWGGFYERFMRIIKDKIVRNFDVLTFKSWPHVVLAVSYLERLINSRPITFVSTERSEFDPITPNQIINPQSPENFEKYVANALVPLTTQPLRLTELKQAHHDLRTLYKALRLHTQMEYTNELRHFHADKKFHHKGKPTTVNIGDVVLLSPNAQFKTAPTLRTKTWEHAQITKLHLGRDNVIRAVDVRVIKDGKLANTLRRPIQSVSPLEVIHEENETSDSEDHTHNSLTQESPITTQTT
jgi:hypothetical protein